MWTVRRVPGLRRRLLGTVLDMQTPSVPDRALDQRSAIVTGAGSGIGYATAVALSGAGARVIAVDRSADRLAALVNDHPAASFITVVGDIADPGTVERAVSAAETSVTLLVNNAGIMDGFLPPAEVDDTTWERVFAVNVTAPMQLTRAVLPGMLAAQRGAIVNVSSEASLRGSVSGAAYSASKHALNGLTKSTAFFYRSQGIRANAVLPGGVRTNIEAPFRSTTAAEVLGPILGSTMPPMAEPEEVAALIVWLLSDAASNVNGALIPCDGAWSVV